MKEELSKCCRARKKESTTRKSKQYFETIPNYDCSVCKKPFVAKKYNE